MTKGFASDKERETAERDETQWLNKKEMLRLIAEHDLWIRRDDLENWRPTVRESGEITGVKDGLTIIATDGVLAYFEVEGDFDVFFGHIQHFTGEVRTLFSTPKRRAGVDVIKPAAAPKPKVSAAAMRLLQKIQAQFAQK